VQFACILEKEFFFDFLLEGGYLSDLCR